MFTRITLPQLMPTVMLVAVIQIVMQFQLFGQALLMTNGGPSGTSRPIVMYIYETAFVRWDVGKGAAASEILFLIILCAAMLQFWLVRRRAEG